jgi:hypothetical protein
MAFSKTYPKASEKSIYPKWVEIYLSEEEEKEAETFNRNKNLQLMRECIDDARVIVQEKRLHESQQPLIEIAIALFEKRASHDVFYKENKTKQKFDEQNRED